MDYNAYLRKYETKGDNDLDYQTISSGKMKEGLPMQSLFLCGFRSGAAGDGLLSVCFGYPMNIDKPSHFNRSSG